MYNDEDLKNWTKDALNKYFITDKVILMPLAEVGVGGTWRLADLMYSQQEVIEEFCKEQKIFLHDIIQNHVIVIPIRYLDLECFDIHVDKSLEYEVKHIIGSRGNNIKKVISNLNSLKTIPEHTWQVTGFNWVKEEYHVPFKMELKRINVIVSKD